MQGKIKRKQAVAYSRRMSLKAANETADCAMCGRHIPPKQRDLHHLIPKSRGGKITILLHRLCHRQIHAFLTIAELEKDYPTIESLQQHPKLAGFIIWVQNKPPTLTALTRKSRDLGIG